MMLRKSGKSQAAVDFMVSYGVALLIVAVAIYVIFRIGAFNGNLTPSSCNPAPSFSCAAYALSDNGLLTFVMSQATGGQINITGVACSTGINSVGNLPEYGNTGVQSSAVSPGNYSGSNVNNGIIMYSGSSASITVPCFSSNFGGALTSQLGTTQTAYVWINYTTNQLPPDYHTVLRVLEFSTKSS